MEVIETKNKIEELIEGLDKLRKLISGRATKRARAIAEYDKILALTMIRLRNGAEVNFEGEPVQDPPVTIIEKLAKGMCFKERLEMEVADSEYKSLITNIETVKAELNGYQSINRHLSET